MVRISSVTVASTGMVRLRLRTPTGGEKVRTLMFFIFTPQYGSMEGVLSLLCVILFVCLFVCLFLCTVTDFPAAEKARGVKFCTRVGLLPRQVFSPFG